MTRSKIVAANWKMYLTREEGVRLVDALMTGMPELMNVEVVIAPPFPHLDLVVERCTGTPVKVGAQNCHPEISGAFTGEVSVEILRSFGVTYVITGHSERRQYFQDTNDEVRDKVFAILRGGLTPIFCCGESLEIRHAGQQGEYVANQLTDSLLMLGPDAIQKVVIAYEPIWAIGTGISASPDQAQEMHAYIRQVLDVRYGTEIADNIRILYGGSIKPDNASALFNQPDVDGGLVGGASLQSAGFLEIIRAACG